MTAILLLVASGALVAFAGLMAALEAALSVTSRGDLQEWSTTARARRSLRAIAAHPDAHANAVVFIRILTETAAAVLVTVALTILFDSIWWAMLAAVVLMTGASFVLVGASPRTVGRQHATALLRICAPIIRFVRVLLGPIANALVAAVSRSTPDGRRPAPFASEQQLLSMVDEAVEADLIEDEDRELIHSVFSFTDTYVRAVMVPRTDVVTLDSSATTANAMDLFLRTGVSRLPVVEGDDDDVVGMLYLKDLVQFSFGARDRWRTQSTRGILRPAVYIPESMMASTLLAQMKKDAVHVCMVVDEYGGVSGLVTLEDLIEELVGEIADEYDPPQDEVSELEPGRYRVSARMTLGDLGELFDIEIDDDDVESVGGLLGKALGRIPQPGAQAEAAGIIMTGGASRGRGRGISTVFVERSPELQAAADELAASTGEIATIGERGRRGEARD
ncbi:hemolysin family protein [Microbacterium sp. LRZ72]|uniref:hemolysin family protein n=1 Tax=Microbacterium sp. LRZ72 TaxID=2942481 RepID=UPI0029B87A98|nr:hemolysin family protein [Microbacterium sp. LRZ72]MDX2375459.1 hemolysin family protein [Microbacterium sp. LRZ72]